MSRIEVSALFPIKFVAFHPLTQEATGVSAWRNGRFVLHETWERFVLANDSVTVAVEVPIYFMPEDLEHMWDCRERGVMYIMK